ncbi:DHHW family protein [Clostridium grantii]|nr:DHHW family protein [Clostridium grantii]
MNFFNEDKRFSKSENRVLDQRPIFSLKEVLTGDFTKDYEKYICDQFVFRDFWINIHSDMMLALGKKENNDVFYTDSGYLIQHFKKPDMAEIDKKIENINSLAASIDNVSEYFMLVPNSGVILKEKLPYKAPDNNPVAYLEIIKNLLNKKVVYVDVLDKLKSKKNEYIFYKTDHHWTTKGAFYAYEELANEMGFKAKSKEEFKIKKVTTDFYGTLYSKGGFNDVSPDSIEIYTSIGNNKVSVCKENSEIENQLYHFEYLKEKDKYSVFLGGNYPLIKIESEIPLSDNKGKLLLIKDSYANCFVPFLISHFSEIYMVDLRYYDDDLKELIEDNNINSILYLYNEITFLNGD